MVHPGPADPDAPVLPGGEHRTHRRARVRPAPSARPGRVRGIRGGVGLPADARRDLPRRPSSPPGLRTDQLREPGRRVDRLGASLVLAWTLDSGLWSLVSGLW